MRVRTMAAAALAAATLTIGGSAAAYASTPAPPPPGAKDTIKVFSCKDGKITVEEARLADAGEPGVVFRIADGEAVAGEAGPRLHVTQGVPTDVATLQAVPAQPLPAGEAGVMITRTYAGDAVQLAEPKAGESCSGWAQTVPAVPAQPVK